ncbi:MAG: mandelate racemase/muconate lactonizing enzyme family protein, partial [Armatimonadetes bacterium]|nr:mandelate racemase/muconate lactonizing enzyme family protein [Armatimonadota bacterium]
AAQADEAACPAGRARWLEWEQTLAPLRDQLVEGFPQRDGAQVAVPEGPGLGIEVDEARCEAFR